MKSKSFFILLALLLSPLFNLSVAFAKKAPAPLPVYPSERAIVFDIKTAKGRANDNIYFMNLTQEEAGIEIYYYTKETDNWILFGTVYSKEYGRAIKVVPSYQNKKGSDEDIGKKRFFAILPKVAGEFDYSIAKKNHDLYINVLPINPLILTQEEKEVMTIIDTSTVYGSFKDNIRMVNASGLSDIDFLIWGSGEEEEPVLLGSAKLKENGDTCFIQTPLDKLYIYRYIYVVSKPPKHYEIQAKKEHNDLYLYLSDAQEVKQEEPAEE